MDKHGRIMCVIVRYVIFRVWMVELTHLLQKKLLDFIICCVSNLLGLPLCWCVISVQKVGILDALHHPWTKYWLANDFAFNAFKYIKVF
jgi:hypothetical protein